MFRNPWDGWPPRAGAVVTRPPVEESFVWLWATALRTDPSPQPNLCITREAAKPARNQTLTYASIDSIIAGSIRLGPLLGGAAPRGRLARTHLHGCIQPSSGS